ncbi:hypothetical protein NRIC_06680 [Enterococcus florum]|uniref:MapZ extracellular domain-containing protein n=1 Tax=Enterococcus florum TaxID=2480627 RepID=A0A4P5P4N6_9ENTE|nr:cell division site-positioning protein MapZ family protein [Enterococcus florum]GCF92777.1 hypothetical protein NRIC_06680 [Enterococcus florum]
MHRCPNCGFELEDKIFAASNEHPVSFKKRETDVLTYLEQTASESEWLELSRMPAGFVEDPSHSKDSPIKIDTDRFADEFEINPVLARYIQEHKEAEKVAQKLAHEDTKNDLFSRKAPEIQNQPVKQTTKKRRRKKSLIVLCMAVLLLGGSGYYVYQAKEAEAQRIAALEKDNKACDQVEKKIKQFYLDQDQTYVDPEMVWQDREALEKELKQVKDTKRYDQLKASYDRLVEKTEQLKEVNFLFTHRAIQGDELSSEMTLKRDMPVNLTVDTGDEAFDQLLNEAVRQAKEQYRQLDEAKQKTALLYQGEKVNARVTREQYDQAAAAVKEVKNQQLVKVQKQQLAAVDQFLTETEEYTIE